MSTQRAIDPSAHDLTGTVLANLAAGSALQPQINATLNSALKSQLAAAASTANLPTLVGLINAMPAADLAAAQGLSLQAFVQQQIDPMVSGDPAMKTAIDNEIANLPLSRTVGTTLSLTAPLASHPLLSGVVADAQLTSLLAASPAITAAMQARFVALYNANQGAIPDFWTSLAADPQLGAVVPQLQLTLQLGTLTQNNPDLVAKLQAQFKPTSVRDLTRLSADQLTQLMAAENVQIPAAIAATTTPATIAQYATAIVSSLKAAFPTDYVAKSFGASTDAANQAVARFLGASSDFDFAATNIDAYLTANPAAVAGQSPDQVAALTDRLKAAQRVFRVIPDGDVMQTLIASGLDSSYEIAATPSGSFIAQYADTLGGEDQAQQIYANAGNISGLVSLIIRQVQENADAATPRMIQGRTDKGSKSNDGNASPAAIPDWQTLFGSTSSCQCTECRAIDGPASYFVSLLEFLKRLPKTNGHTPLDVLMSRRPDLGHLKLNCANADTALPYVDLVNEIMESYIRHTGDLTKLSAHNTPSDATTAALDVNPEYTQTQDAIAAYQKLNDGTVVYPYTLPFDRDLAIVRNYLSFLGVSLYQLIQAFGIHLMEGGPSSPKLGISTRLAAEYLTISEPEFILIANQDFGGTAPAPHSGLWDYYGYQDSDRSDWSDKIAKVPEFLSRTGVTFDQLVDLLQTQYLNPQHLDPGKAASLDQKNTSDLCDITGMSIAHKADFIAALPPFIRLWRKLGWSISELDYALRAFKQTPATITGHELRHVPAKFVLIAAQIQQLRTTLNLSVRQAVSLWQDIDTDGRTSPFMSLFQNKAVLNPSDPGLRLLYQVPLSALPSALPTSWPDGSQQGSAFYANGHLQFIGGMTDSQRARLLTWAGENDDAELAVQMLYSQRWYDGIELVGQPPTSSPEIRAAFTPQITTPGGVGTPPVQIPGGAPPPPPPPSAYTGESISSHINAILAALRISASDLLAIVQDLGYFNGDADWGTLTVAHLSGLHRHATLARTLGLSVPDLIALKTLTGIKPASIASGKDGPETAPMMQFVAAAQQVTASQFTVAQLAFLYGLDDPAANSLAPLQTTQDALMATILTGLQNIAAANTFAPDPTGAALRKKLAVLIPSSQQLDATMGLIGGSAIYSVPLAALPSGLTLPAGPVSFVLTATIGGTITENDTVSLTIATGVAGAATVPPFSYAVQAADTLEGVATVLASQINADPTLAAAGVSVTASGAVISLSAPSAVSWTPATAATPPATTATETVTLGGALVAKGPLSSSTMDALNALPGADAAFKTALRSLSYQALDVLTQNLGFLAPAGPTYSFPLSAMATDVTLPAGGQVSFSAGQLICNGPMLNSTLTSPSLISGTDTAYNTALGNLYALAWNPPNAKVSALGSLIDVASTSTAADRYNYVLTGLLASMTNSQSRGLVKQTLAQALGSDPSVVELLIDGNAGLGWPSGLLPSGIVPASSAIGDFLGGLAAAYTASGANPITTIQIDPGVALDGTDPAYADAQWRGKLLPPKTGAYSLAVSVNGTLSQAPTLTISGQAVTLASGTSPPSTINLTAGQLYDMSLAFPGVPAGAQVTLQWCIAPAPLSTLSAIPALAFMPCDRNGDYPTLALLYRIAVLVNGFSMSAAEIAYLSSHGADFAGNDPSSGKSAPFWLAALPAAASDAPALFNQWQRLNALYGFKASLPAGNVTLFDLFAAAAASPQPTQPVSSSITQMIVTATGWNSADVLTMTGPEANLTGFACVDADFRNEIRLVQLAACVAICSTLGLSAQQLFAWANPTGLSGGSPYRPIAQDIQNTVKAKYDDATWLQVGKPLNDKLRESSKEALIAYILYDMPKADYSDADDLYGYFLIDVEMCTCMETSRLVQASAAVQLFVQRCLLNLESEVPPSTFSDKEVTEWNQWRKNYRVWQAAVKVFLNPENWFEPDQRSNKTPFFKDLETTLLQGDVTAANVEAAYLGYLESLQQVARLEIAGLYAEDDTEAGRKVTHVIGRTFTTPHVYFYRKLDNRTYVWSPWEPVDADISGDSLIPVIWNRRLFLFWPLYTEVTDPAQNNPPSLNITTSPAGQNGGSSTTVPQSPPATKTLQIQLAWSEYKDGKWTPKQVTADSLSPKLYKKYASQLDRSYFIFTAAPQSDDGLAVTAYSSAFFDVDSLNNAQTSVISAYTAIDLEIDNLGGNSQTQIDFSSPPGKGISRAVQGANAAIIDLVNANRNNVLYLDQINSASTTIKTVLNATSPPSTATLSQLVALRNTMKTVGNQISDLNNLSPIGSFSFDGSQATVEIDSSPTGNLDDINRFPAVADIYGSAHDQTTRMFHYQDIRIDNSSFSLPLIDAANAGSQPALLLGTAKNISTQTISFLEQRIPGYSIDTADGSLKTALFFADRRRTYFVANSLSSARLDDASQASSPKDIAKGSLYFFNHYHPWVGELIKRLNWKGISYLLKPETQALEDANGYTFSSHYGPTGNVAKPFPTESIAFGPTPGTMVEERQTNDAVPAGDFAYSIYNWELFFYIPLLIATRLSQNQKFEDAQTWFHYIFNPTQNSTWKSLPAGYNKKNEAPYGYWNFQPLNVVDDDKNLADLLKSGTGKHPSAMFSAQLDAWEDAPFEPDVIARLRPVAYQKAVVMKYLDNLIAWGDYLFTQNTRESINEAIQLYILADEILGKKPVTIPQAGTILDYTYDQLKGQLPKDGNDGFGNVNVKLENVFPFVIFGTPSKAGEPSGRSIVPTTPYFCTPSNPTLLGYYDTVADRLYKIRHCMNIQGQVEQLPLFAPAINPALLIAAEAAGVDLSSVLNDIGAAVPHYRFSYMMPKALELCAEVRSLGAALLAALEKRDAEGLALLRARQEVSVQKAVRQIKELQITEASDNQQGLVATKAVTTARRDYYQGLVQEGLSSYETEQVVALTASEGFKQMSQAYEIDAAQISSLGLQFTVGINGVCGSPSSTVNFGSEQAAAAARATAGQYSAMAEASSFVASMSGLTGGWDRRAAEWVFQLQTATLELDQIQRQINAADIRVKIATQDLANQELQIANASAVEDALKSKFTNQELYGWMVGRVSAVFFQCYQMAYDLARRAEACYRFELGVPQSSYIQFGYWDSLKQGLLSGEKLFQDLKRLEGAYLDQNKREYEIGKSISLLLLDPYALISLKLAGSCLINLPEAYFDMDYPGHYMRRIKSVSLTIPCVTGPYTSVNCTLTLLQSKIRLKNPSATGNAYAEHPVGSDDRFAYDFAATESIATSTAQNDSGMFEVNFRDERYLPFEASGAVSQWRLAMPADCNAFDFDTITDVILNLRYTARNGGAALANAARTAALLPRSASYPPASGQPAGGAPPASFPKTQTNLLRYFSLRHEYPTEWYKFLHPPVPATGASPSASMQINLGNERFPFQYRRSKITITQAELVVVLKAADPTAKQVSPPSSGFSLSNTASPPAQIDFVSTVNPQCFLPKTLPLPPPTPFPPPTPTNPGGPNSWTLACSDSGGLGQAFDIFLVCQYSAASGT